MPSAFCWRLGGAQSLRPFFFTFSLPRPPASLARKHDWIACHNLAQSDPPLAILCEALPRNVPYSYSHESWLSAVGLLDRSSLRPVRPHYTQSIVRLRPVLTDISKVRISCLCSAPHGRACSVDHRTAPSFRYKIFRRRWFVLKNAFAKALAMFGQANGHCFRE